MSFVVTSYLTHGLGDAKTATLAGLMLAAQGCA